MKAVTYGLDCVAWVGVRKERARVGGGLDRNLIRCIVLAVILDVLGKDTIQDYRCSYCPSNWSRPVAMVRDVDCRKINNKHFATKNNVIFGYVRRANIQ